MTRSTWLIITTSGQNRQHYLSSGFNFLFHARPVMDGIEHYVVFVLIVVTPARAGIVCVEVAVIVAGNHKHVIPRTFAAEVRVPELAAGGWDDNGITGGALG